jgi:hypothetical protein
LLPSNFDVVASYSDWRSTWTHIVAGQFSGSKYSGLFFYEQSSGKGEFWESRGMGEINLLNEYSNDQNRWSHVVPGLFGTTGFTGLFLYDQQAGFASVWENAGNGVLVQISGITTRTSWTNIITVVIPTPTRLGLLLYDQTAGQMEVWETDGRVLQRVDGLRTTWTHVVGGEFSSGDQVFFYEGRSGHGELYSIDETGIIPSPSSLGAADGLPLATDVIPGNFGWYGTSLLFYDRSSGRATFVDFNAAGIGDGPTGYVTDGAESYSNWRTSWDIIVAGKFWVWDEEDLKFQNGFTDLLFYDRANGYGEFAFHEPFGAILVEPLEGYASSESVIQGGSIDFHVNSRVGPFTIQIFRQDLNEVFMTTVKDLAEFSGTFPIDHLAYKLGARWPVSATLEIPRDWPSGLYLARVTQLPPVIPPGPIQPAGNDAAAAQPRIVEVRPPLATVDIPFVVRTANPGSQARILLCVPDTTYAAYNFWGGRSLYGHYSRGFKVWSLGSSSQLVDNQQSPRAFRVSLHRPHDPIYPGERKWLLWEVSLIRWLVREGIAAEMCTSTDIHENGALLQNYRLLVSVGHDEYWSKNMRDSVQALTVRGGNVAFLSGNVCWWQIRFEQSDDASSQSDTIVCYKDRRFDPCDGTQNEDLVTVNWYDQPVSNPETSMTGVSYFPRTTYSGWVSRQQFVVQNPNHWALAGTGLYKEDFFGLFAHDTQTTVGPETDRYQNRDSPPIHSPTNFEKAAIVFWSGEETATMGSFENGGKVFTAATIDWALGLSQDGSWGVIDQITRNVFDQLG